MELLGWTRRTIGRILAPGRRRPLVLGFLLPLLLGSVWGQTGATRSYYVYVCAESEDEVALVRFGGAGTQVVKTIPVGSFPTEIEGPHGIKVSPDGKYWYVSLAHGNPFGRLHKYETGSDEWVGDVRLGLFPATLDISPATGLIFAVNFNLHGAMEPSTISVVEPETMTEVEEIATGIMPHGSRFATDGIRHYSVNMMSDSVVEIDSLNFAVSRTLLLGEMSADGHAHDFQPETGSPPESFARHRAAVQPTWVTAPTAAEKIYVAGNNVNKIFEIDLSRWEIERVFSTSGSGPYNLAITPDGVTLIATYKKGQSIGFWDLKAGKETAKVQTSRPIPHGLVVTPDGRFVFVSLEGIGGEPGVVEVYDLSQRRRVGRAEVGKQAGGIAFWKIGPAK